MAGIFRILLSAAIACCGVIIGWGSALLVFSPLAQTSPELCVKLGVIRFFGAYGSMFAWSYSDFIDWLDGALYRTVALLFAVQTYFFAAIIFAGIVSIIPSKSGSLKAVQKVVRTLLVGGTFVLMVWTGLFNASYCSSVLPHWVDWIVIVLISATASLIVLISSRGVRKVGRVH